MSQEDPKPCGHSHNSSFTSQRSHSQCRAFSSMISGIQQVTTNQSVVKKSQLADYQKQVAVLEQRVELLTLQLQESQEREQSIKANYDNMLKAFNNDPETSVPFFN